jgi:hypothetical protein
VYNELYGPAMYPVVCPNSHVSRHMSKQSVMWQKKQELYVIAVIRQTIVGTTSHLVQPMYFIMCSKRHVSKQSCVQTVMCPVICPKSQSCVSRVSVMCQSCVSHVSVMCQSCVKRNNNKLSWQKWKKMYNYHQTYHEKMNTLI